MTHALIVDDKQESRYYLRVLLEGNGWSVTEAKHGAEALVKARQAPPDLLISDLLMPVMDGYTLLHQWKLDARLQQIPFIVYTATYTQAQDERLALDLGADAFIRKPCEPEALLSRVREVLDGSAGGSLPRVPVADEPALMRVYSEALIRKLEEKTAQLEQTNRALEQEQAVLRMREHAIEALSQGIIIADAAAPGLPIVYASPSFQRMTGYSAAEMLGKNCRILQCADSDPAAVAQIREALRARRGCTVELLNQRKDKTRFWNRLAISPVLDARGELTHFVGVQTDATEQRRLEVQLRQSQKMEAVGALAAGVAHDFNNLLSVILSYSSALLSELPPAAPMRSELQEIQFAGERATHLTRQLLAFSRQQVLQPQLVDLRQVASSMRNMLSRILGEDVELSLILAPGRGKVLADPSQLEQVIMNLVVNARQAMPRGGALSLEVSDAELGPADAARLPDAAPGNYVRLTVRDTGVGMDAATRERIFEPFFTTKEVGKGTGLGLSTVFGIVQQSRGVIDVESAPGRGAVFQIYLPRVEEQAAAAQAAREVSAPSGTGTILLVEDDDQVRAATRMVLRRHGYTVLEARGGEEALRLAAQHPEPLDLVVTDLVMPRMSGKELAEELTRARPGLRVLFVSGYAEKLIDPGMLPAGLAFLQKPLTRETLIPKVRELLAGA